MALLCRIAEFTVSGMAFKDIKGEVSKAAQGEVAFCRSEIDVASLLDEPANVSLLRHQSRKSHTV